MVKWEDGTLVSPAEVNSDGTITPAVYQGRTPLKAYNLNKMQTDILQIMQEIETPTPKTGENITLTDSKEGKFKNFKISGNSWQATRSGKNKFDISKATKASGSCSFKNNGDSIDITATHIGEYISANIDITDLFKEGETIYAKANFVASSSNTGAYRIQWGEDSGLAKGDTVLMSSTSDSVKSGVVPTKPEGATKLFLYLYGNVEGTVAIGDTVTYSKIMLSNQPITDYEEYGASPSPKFPSEIRNCGDNVNLLDLSTEILFYGNLNSDNKSITCNINNNYYSLIRTAALNEYLMKHRGETITFSTGTPIKGKTTSIVILGNMTTGANYYEINEENTGKCSITIPKEFSNITNLELRFNRQMTPFTDTTTQIKYLKLEKGSKATPYSPYNCGNVNLKVQNKNFLNVPQNYVLTGNEIINLNLEAGNYIINWEDIVTQGTSTNMLMMFYYEDETEYARYISPTYVSKSLPLNIIKNVTKVRIYSQDGYNSSQNVTTTFKNLMISKNGGDYVPHEEQTITFPLAEGQVLHEEDYLAEDGIHHKRKTVILDGTENWSVIQDNIFYITLNDIKLLAEAMSSHFAYTQKKLTDLNDNEFTTMAGQGYSVWIKREGLTLDQWKAYLAEQYANGTPITVEYDLAEEEIEPYTAEQQVAYNKIKELYSYEDVTHISSDDEIKPKYEVTYLRDLQKLFNNMTV